MRGATMLNTVGIPAAFGKILAAPQALRTAALKSGSMAYTVFFPSLTDVKSFHPVHAYALNLYPCIRACLIALSA